MNHDRAPSLPSGPARMGTRERVEESSATPQTLVLPPMSRERMGEIALLYVQHKMKKDGIPVGPEAKRRIGQTAKDLGISTEEAVHFVAMLTHDFVSSTYPQIQK